MPQLDLTATVARIVTDHPATARVFQAHGIDYCCHGDVGLEDACRRAKVDAAALAAELHAVLAASPPRPADNPSTLSTAALVARIIDTHHAYLRQALPYVAPIVEKVARVHGAKEARLAGVAEAFRALAGSLGPHLDEEEEVLFPLLMARRPDPAAVEAQLSAMREEHLAVGDLLARIRELTDAFTTPEWGCNTYRVLMSELEALEADVLRHVHLENHVLAPRFTVGARAA